MHRHAGRRHRVDLLLPARTGPRSSRSPGGRVKINDDTVTYYTRRLQGGVSNRLEVDQAKANRAVTAATIPDIERQIAHRRERPERAARPAAGARSPAGRPLGGRGLPPKVPAGLPAQLLERRPDVVQAEQLLVAANANIGVAKALFYPTISLTGSLGAVSSSLSDFLTPESLVWSLGAGLFQPIFNGGRIRQNYEAARRPVRPGAGPVPEGRAQRLPGGGRLARDDSRSSARAADGDRDGRRGAARRHAALARRGTTRGCRATSRCSSPTSSCSPQEIQLAQVQRLAVPRRRAALPGARRRVAAGAASGGAATRSSQAVELPPGGTRDGTGTCPR